MRTGFRRVGGAGQRRAEAALGRGRGRPALQTLGILLGVAAAIACAPGPGEPGAPPRNVLLVSIDTLRADYLGCYGDARAETDAIDGLAAGGVLFEAALAPAPLTLPSHATLLTGVEPRHHGIRHNGVYRLADEYETLAERLAEEGWDTAGIVGGYPLVASSGLGQGFARYDDRIPLGPAGTYHSPERRAAEVTEAALAWLTQRPSPGSPFLLFLHYYDPHVPYDPPAGYVAPRPGEPEGLAAYRGEIAYVDDQLARVLEALDAAGERERTLIVVTADHGEGLMQHRELTHGIFLYEEIVRVPLILHHPPTLGRGGRVAEVVGLADVAPTVLEALGVAFSGPVDGRSLWAMARGESAARRAVFAESHVGRLEYGWAPLRAVRTRSWKYIEAPRAELYHLDRDPGETTNLVERHVDTAAELRERLVEAFRQEVADRPVEIDDEQLERLRALGYLQGSTGAAPDESAADLPDPKDRIELSNQLQIASFELMQGRADAAERRLAQLAARDPANVTVRCRLADARLARSDYAGAERVLREALEIADEPAKPAVLWTLAALERRRGNYDRAVELYRSHAAIAPLSARTVDRMVTTLRQAGRPDEAETVARAWLERTPESLPGWQVLARLLEERGRTEQARTAWQRVLELRPDDAEATAALGPATRSEESTNEEPARRSGAGVP